MFEQHLSELIACPSYGGQEVAVAEKLAELCQRSAPHLQTEVQTYSHTGRNVIVQGEQPRLLIDVHLDTVPPVEAWQRDPLTLVREGDKLIGLGAVDNKSGIALCLELMRETRGEVMFAFCGGEETDVGGVQHLLDQGLPDSIEVALVMEPTGLQLITAHKGVGLIEVELHGRAAHASDPSKGSNAILAASDFLHQWERVFDQHKQTHPRLGSNTWNVGSIRGGEAANIVADRCQLMIDVRTLTGQTEQEILQWVQQAAAPLRMAHEVRTQAFVPPFEYAGSEEPKAVVLQAAGQGESAGEFWAHSGLYAQAGIPALLFGPGSIDAAHQPDEYVTGQDLKAARQVLSALIQHYQGGRA